MPVHIQRRFERGFTLIEIMVVVVIIGLLAAFVLVNYLPRVDEARITKARSDLQSIETALAMYRLDTARYPNTTQGLVALVKKPEDVTVRNWKEGGYISRVSRDPWGNNYHYRYPGIYGREYDLYSLGPDNLEGSPESDKDNIVNWNLD